MDTAATNPLREYGFSRAHWAFAFASISVRPSAAQAVHLHNKGCLTSCAQATNGCVAFLHRARATTLQDGLARLLLGRSHSESQHRYIISLHSVWELGTASTEASRLAIQRLGTQLCDGGMPEAADALWGKHELVCQQVRARPPDVRPHERTY